MEFSHDLGGGSTACIKKHQVAASNTVLGVPYIALAAGETGIKLASTTGAADFLGVNIDAAGTYVTAQQTDSADTLRTTKIIVNPHACYRALLSGGAGDGTAMTLYTAVSGGSDGLTIVTDNSNVASPDTDETIIYCLTGANMGRYNKVTTASSATWTFIRAWPSDVAAGDTFMTGAGTPCQTVALTLNTSLTQIRGDLAPTGAAFSWVDLLFNDRTSSYAFIISGDSWFSGRPT